VVTGEGAIRRRPADRGAATVNDSRTSASPLSSCPPATSHAPAGRAARSRIRSAVTAGLLVTVALPALSLTGTAYAEDSAPRPKAPSAAAPAAQAPSAAAPKDARDSAHRPSPVPSHPSQSARPSHPSAQPSAASSAAPAPARDELAETGASTTTNVALGAGAALLIAVGGGAVYAARRRRTN
ncbi:LAETG motif-containing sortase-dependent surface protein, partial [Streptomyces rimosus]